LSFTGTDSLKIRKYDSKFHYSFSFLYALIRIGHPKGVNLSYLNYNTNQKTFESYLGFGDDANTEFIPIVVNPLHHTNSTSITDWALRRPGSHVHLFERYFTQYWKIVVSIILNIPVDDVNESLTLEQANHLSAQFSDKSNRFFKKIVCPLVSRHIDFLESLSESNALGVNREVLKFCLEKTILLLGSAPVGPTTTARLLKYANNLPTVRFGSTETTLQGTVRFLIL